MSEVGGLADKIKRLFFGTRSDEAAMTTTTTLELAQPKNMKIQQDAEDNNVIARQVDVATVDSSVSFKVFSKEMENFLNYTKEHDKLFRYYVHQRPHITDKQLNCDIDELQSLMAEIKNSLTTIKKLKAQQKLIRKDIASVKKSVKKCKDNEIHELETIVSCYDKDMFDRWLKTKWKPDDLEGLMFDVQEKKLALESLEKLINLQLSKNEDNTSDDWESVNDLAEASDEKAPTETAAVADSSTLIIQIEPKTVVTAQSPALPPRPSIHNRISTRFAWEHRRFRAERRGHYSSAVVKSITETQESEPAASTLTNYLSPAVAQLPISYVSNENTDDSLVTIDGSNNITQVDTATSDAGLNQENFHLFD